MYEKTTRAITVAVEPFFLDEQSNPAQSRFFWAYHVVIQNDGTTTVQLRNRYWHITDSLGRIQEVHGAGVVGEEPVLRPGERFQYTSGTPLATPSGIMVGRYEMEAQDGERFDVDIPAFSLDSPHQSMRMN